MAAVAAAPWAAYSEEDLAGFNRFMTNVRNNECSDSVYFEFPASGIFHAMTQHRMDFFCDALTRNTVTTRIQFMIQRPRNHGTIDDVVSFWETVGRAFGAMSQLKSVEFKCTRIRNGGDGVAIAAMLSQMPQVERLSFSFGSGGEPLDLGDCHAVARALAARPTATDVDFLRIAEVPPGGHDVILSSLSSFTSLAYFCYAAQTRRTTPPLDISLDTAMGIVCRADPPEREATTIILQGFFMTERTCQALSKAFQHPNCSKRLDMVFDECQVAHGCTLQGLESNTSLMQRSGSTESNTSLMQRSHSTDSLDSLARAPGFNDDHASSLIIHDYKKAVSSKVVEPYQLQKPLQQQQKEKDCQSKIAWEKIPTSSGPVNHNHKGSSNKKGKKKKVIRLLGALALLAFFGIMSEKKVLVSPAASDNNKDIVSSKTLKRNAGNVSLSQEGGTLPRNKKQQQKTLVNDSKERDRLHPIQAASRNNKLLLAPLDPYISNAPYNYSEPLSKPLKVPYPIFVLNLPKSGTTTIWQYFECGLGPHRAVHWWVQKNATTSKTTITANSGSRRARGTGRKKTSIEERRENDYNVGGKQVGPCLEHNIANHQPPLYRCGHYDVWVDCGYSLPRLQKCFFPAVHALDAIYESYPDATLLWIRRDVEEWYNSAAKWGNMLRKWSQACRSSFFPEKVDGALTGEDYKDFYRQTTQRIRQFAKDHPSMTYLEPLDLTLSSPELGSWLEEHVGIAESCWGKCQPDGQNAKCE